MDTYRQAIITYMKNETPLVAIIEDDPRIRQEMLHLLERWKLRAEAIEDFENAMAGIVALKPSLLVLDINLPYTDGFHLCAELRKSSKIPVLIVSARSSTMDTVMALAQGADDYLAKPFDPEMFIAKVQALLRRSYEYSFTMDENLRCGSFILVRAEGVVRAGDKCENLTRNEYLIAQALMKRAGSLLERDELMQALWHDEIFVDDNTLSVNVSRLRKKLENLGQGDPIETLKGRGYRFAST